MATLAVAVLCLTGLAAPPAYAQQSPPTDIALAWGFNDSGQLGDGSITNRRTPVGVDLPAGTQLTAIAAGQSHSIALTSDGRVLTWGGNFAGQLGDGTTTQHTTPVEALLPAGTHATAVDAGRAYSMALTSDGRVFAWGQNLFGQLADGTTTDRHTPVEMTLPTGAHIAAIVAGDYTSVLLTSDGRVLSAGYNMTGQLGNGSAVNQSTSLVEALLPPDTQVTGVFAQGECTLALTSDGHLLAWGYNAWGQLGDGTTTNRRTPVAVHLPAGTTVTTVGAGHAHNLALTTDGGLFAWGNNYFGQLGDGTTTDRHTPVEIQLPAGTKATKLAGGNGHSMALTSDGRIITWGSNTYGQLGDGTLTNRSTPGVTVQLPAGQRATAIAAGDYFSLALAVRSTSHTTLTATPTTVTQGDEVTLTAHVTCDAGTPTGNVVFYAGSTPIGTGTLDASGNATLTTTTLPVGPNEITAHYEGDADCPPSESIGVVVIVETVPSPVPGISLTKEVASAGPFEVGDTVDYTYTVTNTGDTTLHQVTVTDDRVTGVACAATTLSAGNGTTCQGSHTITAADITPCEPANGGCALTNLAQATAFEPDGHEVASEQATATLTVQQQEVSGLTLAKRADATGPFQVGDSVDYTYTVTNSGDSALSSVAVTDDRVADVDCGTTTLAAGASTTCHGTYTVTEADASCGPRGSGDGGYGDHGTTCPVTNTAHATATDAEGATVTSNTATATIRVSSGNGGGHDGYGSGSYGNGSGYGRGKKEAKTA
ncbi:Ig-like domain repeat protein [Streptomyces sp. NPDC048718]|uniref:RCC1 domain-containing protein n=1 Tax=Streptomyces sp. NPDC048718 TaxID=3365587 RepID=UPI003721C7D0